MSMSARHLSSSRQALFRVAPPLLLSGAQHARQATGVLNCSRSSVLAPATQIATPCCRPSGSNRSTRSLTICMAHPRRVAKVSSTIQRELGRMFVEDPVMVNAITPERRTGGDDISALASITHVYVSNDLQVVKVYVSIYSDNRGKQRAMENLHKLEGYVRREMGQRVVLRLTPEYRFEYDDTLEEAEMVTKVIGPEEVARFTRELDEEAGILRKPEGSSSTLWPSGSLLQSEQSGGADGGFFDMEDGDVIGSGSTGRGMIQGDGKLGTFADHEEDEFGDEDEGEYVEMSSADVFNRPGPFDDLFQSPSERQRAQGRGKGRRQGGRGGRQGGAGRGRGPRAGTDLRKESLI